MAVAIVARWDGSYRKQACRQAGRHARTGVVGDEVHPHSLVPHEVEEPQGTLPLETVSEGRDGGAVGHLGGLDPLLDHLIEEFQSLLPLLSLRAGCARAVPKQLPQKIETKNRVRTTGQPQCKEHDEPDKARKKNEKDDDGDHAPSMTAV